MPSAGLAAWLADPDHAADLAGRLAEGLVTAADLLRDEDVHGVLDALVRERVDGWRWPRSPGGP